jgi:hypothetical protein
MPKKKAVWWTCHCGAFRSFDVLAPSEKGARIMFGRLAKQSGGVGIPHGFTPKDITSIELARRQDA